jgi:iron complex transport system substrate-binding protein
VGSVRSVNAAGAGTFYNGLIEAAGGRNAIVDSIPHYPKLSLEGIITVAPDVIIDVAPAMGPYACSTLVADWESVSMVPAVEQDRVYCLAADYATVPGPRLTLLLNDLRELVERYPNE